MKLTNYIIDMGRMIAFPPGLKRVTGSTTATILLCQLIYWIDKTTDGWIYKDSYDLEEETGLSVYEQQTARKILIDKGLLEENYKRLDHKIAFRVNEEVLNALWEETSGKMSNPRYAKKEEEKPIPVPQPVNLRDFQDPSLHPDHPANRSDATKKGDLVDAVIDLYNSPGAKKEAIKNKIRNNMENKFHINMQGKEWDTFIEYVWGRQERHNEPAEKFIQYALTNGFDPMYWTPKKCLTMYPRAFMEEKDKIREDFVTKPAAHVEEEYADMPEHLKKKKKLY